MSEPAFGFVVRRPAEGFVTFELAGAVDLTTVGPLDRALESLELPVVLTVDLGEVTFLDTSGMSFLIRAHKHVAERGGRLSVLAGSGRPRRILEATGIGAYLDIR